MRILYVEDNLTNLTLVQRLARVGNHHVINHADGETALANFESDKPDLVLMDIQLKGALNGLDVVKTLRARGIKTPIIAVTAYAMLGDRERCLEAGCDAYLAKPLPVEQLVALFERYDPKPETASTAVEVQLTPEAPPNGAVDSVKSVQPPASSDAPVAPEATTEAVPEAAKADTSDTEVPPTPPPEAAVEAKPEAVADTPKPASDTPVQAAPEATVEVAPEAASDTALPPLVESKPEVTTDTTKPVSEDAPVQPPVVPQPAVEVKADSSPETTEPAARTSSDKPGDNTNKS